MFLWISSNSCPLNLLLVSSHQSEMIIVKLLLFILRSSGSVRRYRIGDHRTFHCNDYFVTEEIRTCLGVFNDPMFLWISSNSCPRYLLLVRSHQAEIIIVKHLIQERKSVTRVPVELRSFDQGRRKNDAFLLSATLSTSCKAS